MYKEMLRELFPYLKPHKKKALGAVVFSLLLALISGAQLKLVNPLFTKGLNASSEPREIYFLAGALLGLGILNFPIRFYHFYWLRFIGDKIVNDMREHLFAKIQKLPTSFYNKNKQGYLMSVVSNDTEMFAQSFRASVDVIREPAKAVVYLGLAINADWVLTTVILIVGPLFVLIFQISGKKVKANQHNVQEGRADLTHSLNEGIASHKVTKAFNLQKYVLGRFNKSQKMYFDAQMKTTVIEEIAHPFVELVGAFAFSLVLVLAYYRVQASAMTIGDFIQFVGALALLMDPIRKFSQANVKMSQGKAALERLKEILRLDEEKDEGQVELKTLTKGIEVKDLTFSYGEMNVIQNLNLSVQVGQKIALVGLSGSGKSTLINLLLGLYQVEKGMIFIDGVDIHDVKLKNLRTLFGLVSQDIFLFHDTIRENLTLGNLFSTEEINHALDVAYATEFIQKLPQGIQTVIGDRGTRLSGGQQQRLTIARAFLQGTPVLLFDEATSALDNESEKVVQKALEKIAGEKTVIAVAHRLSTIQDYDCIYVMKEGRLVEKGTHQELMELSSEYKKLYELSKKE